MFKRIIATLICVTFSFNNLQYVYAQDFSVNQLPVPGTMVGESSPFAPLALKGLVVNLQKPLEFQFIVDTGEQLRVSVNTTKGPQDTASIKDQANQLVKYFLAGLTIPEGDLWVNLSPYEKNRMVPEALGQTDLGRDLLAQDYILKQLTASLIYPEKNLGKEFWSRVYAKAQQQFGTTNIPVNTLNKVWILPDQAQVFENVNAAYVTKATLKVMLDEDYLALNKQTNKQTNLSLPLNGLNKSIVNNIGSQIVREIVLPEIEKEVNTGKNFAPLRQIYQALILAKWYKEKIQNGLLDAIYINKNKIVGVNLNDLAVKEQIYERYLKAYKKGTFNYIKEYPTPDGQVVARKYFSGGISKLEPVHVATDGTSAMVSADGAMAALDISLKVSDAAVEEKDPFEGQDAKAIESEIYKRYFLFIPTAPLYGKKISKKSSGTKSLTTPFAGYEKVGLLSNDDVAALNNAASNIDQLVGLLRTTITFRPEAENLKALLKKLEVNLETAYGILETQDKDYVKKRLEALQKEIEKAGVAYSRTAIRARNPKLYERAEALNLLPETKRREGKESDYPEHPTPAWIQSKLEEVKEEFKADHRRFTRPILRRYYPKLYGIAKAHDLLPVALEKASQYPENPDKEWVTGMLTEAEKQIIESDNIYTRITLFLEYPILYALAEKDDLLPEPLDAQIEIPENPDKEWVSGELSKIESQLSERDLPSDPEIIQVGFPRMFLLAEANGLFPARGSARWYYPPNPTSEWITEKLAEAKKILEDRGIKYGRAGLNNYFQKLYKLAKEHDLLPPGQKKGRISTDYSGPYEGRIRRAKKKMPSRQEELAIFQNWAEYSFDRIYEIFSPIIDIAAAIRITRIRDSLGEGETPLLEYDDLRSIGFMGLRQAYDGFKPEKSDGLFRNFAFARVKGAMHDSLREVDHLSRDTRRLVNLMEEAEDSMWRKLDGLRYPTEIEIVSEMSRLKLEKELKRQPSQEEIDALDKEMLQEYREARIFSELAVTGIEQENEDGETGNILERRNLEHGDGDFWSGLNGINVAHSRMLISKLKEKLTVMFQSLPERRLVFYYFYRHEYMTMKEVGNTLGVNESRVSQIMGDIKVVLEELLRGLNKETVELLLRNQGLLENVQYQALDDLKGYVENLAIYPKDFKKEKGANEAMTSAGDEENRIILKIRIDLDKLIKDRKTAKVSEFLDNEKVLTVRSHNALRKYVSKKPNITIDEFLRMKESDLVKKFGTRLSRQIIDGFGAKGLFFADGAMAVGKNQNLGMETVDDVKNFLVALGIEAHDITIMKGGKRAEVNDAFITRSDFNIRNPMEYIADVIPEAENIAKSSRGIHFVMPLRKKRVTSLPSGATRSWHGVFRPGQPKGAKKDSAMTSPTGGIDLNSANLAMLIKRDGKGVVLPLDQQDLARLSNIEGLDPVILSIKPASQTPVFSQLQTGP